MGKIKEWLMGKKTFMVAGLMVTIGVIQILSGEGDLTWATLLASDDLMTVLAGVGLGTLRAGVN